MPQPSEVCDFDDDVGCGLADINELYDVFDTAIPPTNEIFDLHLDNSVNEADLEQWLTNSATFNGFASPYLRGDTELDRDVDITDFDALSIAFDPSGLSGPNGWMEGNFDGDNDIDITDFYVLSMNFSPGGYGCLLSSTGASEVPEPKTEMLLIIGVTLVFTKLGSMLKVITGRRVTPAHDPTVAR